MFTVEEMNLIQAMDHTCRRMSRTLRKVSAMTDADFAAIDFAVYEEEKNE